jgi:ectoine hydroxylase-related dioxygenase (phytanoyl-CoA dioxygenase family)
MEHRRHMKNTLTAAQVAQYQRDGYIIISRPTFSAAKFARLKQHCETKFAQAADAQHGKPVSLIDCPHWQDPALFEWLLADEMLDLVEPLIGPDIGLFASHLLQKPATAGKRVPWHEDSAYWQKIWQPMVIASITVALEPSLPENGCLRVIPGTHHNGYSDYAPVPQQSDSLFAEEIKAEQYDESKAVDIVLQPNQASIHHVRIIHGSNPNQGASRRAVLTARYFPTTSKFGLDDFPIYLARGEDRAGNRYSDPRQTYARKPAVSTV